MDDDEGLIGCDNCGGLFLPEDMDGDHCAECAEQIFGELDNGQ